MRSAACAWKKLRDVSCRFPRRHRWHAVSPSPYTTMAVMSDAEPAVIHSRPIRVLDGLHGQHLPLPDGRGDPARTLSGDRPATGGSWSTRRAPTATTSASDADRRARAVLAEAGYRPATEPGCSTRSGCPRRDLILAMDAGHLRELQRLAAGSGMSGRAHRRVRDFDPEGPGDVPDPYYDTIVPFREVRDDDRALHARPDRRTCESAGRAGRPDHARLPCGRDAAAALPGPEHPDPRAVARPPRPAGRRCPGGASGRTRARRGRSSPAGRSRTRASPGRRRTASACTCGPRGRSSSSARW